ncbi:MAG: 50S ribosomal protein L4 [bacterium]|nr:50S ribosomal protein L4 [bacterium]
MEIEILNCKGETVEKINLNKEIFNQGISVSLLHEVVKGYLNNRRLGTACTKTRGMVSGSGRKPWKQKGTGRARSGSVRNPIWRGGGIIFGPSPRSYYINLSPKVKRKALCMSLSDKVINNKMKIIDFLNIESNKTKEAVNLLSNLNLEKVLIVVSEEEEKARRPFRNIKNTKVTRAKDLNAYEVLVFPEILFTKDALIKLEERIVEV